MIRPLALTPRIPNSLSDSTICITGGNGYIGMHLTQALIGNGYQPVLIGRWNAPPPSVEGAIGLGPWHDVDDLAKLLSSHQNLVVINIAGHYVRKHEPSDISELVSGNLLYPLQIFEALAESGGSRIVNIGTTWEFDDTGHPEPSNLYAALKAANSSTLQYYGRERHLKGYNIKLNDTYGGLDTRAKLLPMLKRAAKEHQSVKLHAAEQLINLLHITDVIEGLLSAAADTETMAPCTIEQAFLLARKTISLDELARHVVSNIAPNLRIEFTHKRGEAPELRGVWHEAPRLPNWQPRIELSTGLAHYFERIA